MQRPFIFVILLLQSENFSSVENKAHESSFQRGPLRKAVDMTHLQLRFPPLAVGPPGETDLWPSAPVWPTWASQSNHRHGFKQLKEIKGMRSARARLWSLSCDSWGITCLMALMCALLPRLFSAVCRRDAPNVKARINLWNNNNNSTDTLGTFAFVKLIYMHDLKLIILIMNPALVLGSVWFFLKNWLL